MSALGRRLARLARPVLRFCAVEVIGRLLYVSGVLFLIGYVRQRWGRRRLLVPMYHRISRGAANDWELLDIQRGVPLDLFKRQLRVIRWFGPLLRLEEAFDHLHDLSQQRRSVIALTFDDGYREVVTLAVPALRAIGAKATIFPVVRTTSGGRPLWWDELAVILARGSIDGSGLAPVLDGLPKCAQTPVDANRVGASAPREAMADYVCDRFVELSSIERERALSTLAWRLGVPGGHEWSRGLYANWNELREAAAICEMGGHTVDHPVLTCEDPVTAGRQVSQSRDLLRQETGQPIRSFAYPNGRHNTTVRSLAAQAGYRVAVTVQPGVNYESTDPFQLRRVPVYRERPFHLAFKLAFYGWAHRA